MKRSNARMTICLYYMLHPSLCEGTHVAGNGEITRGGRLSVALDEDEKVPSDVIAAIPPDLVDTCTMETSLSNFALAWNVVIVFYKIS